VNVFFGAKVPAGKEIDWVQTHAGKVWNTLPRSNPGSPGLGGPGEIELQL
jgi:hypothetical protein